MSTRAEMHQGAYPQRVDAPSLRLTWHPQNCHPVYACQMLQYMPNQVIDEFGAITSFTLGKVVHAGPEAIFLLNLQLEK